jgi:hypothetical protein
VGSAGFEPAASSAQGWHHTKLDNDPAQRKFSQSECNFNLMNKIAFFLLFIQLSGFGTSRPS